LAVRGRLKPGLHRACCALLVVAVLLSASAASACPMCKAALANAEGQGDLVSGFFWSILFMMSMPFTLLASFSGYMYLQVRRARAAQGISPAPSVGPAAAPAADQSAGV
jgi:heme/copper-type cytochrome/quinol oxidase subunit 2